MRFCLSTAYPMYLDAAVYFVIILLVFAPFSLLLSILSQIVLQCKKKKTELKIIVDVFDVCTHLYLE